MTFWPGCNYRPCLFLHLDFATMECKEETLYRSLGQSKLIIFKGDLNYRKLMGDLAWPTNTTFEVALRGFRPTNIVALRTLKADVVSGLDPIQVEELDTQWGSRDWMTNGQYGLIQVLNKEDRGLEFVNEDTGNENLFCKITSPKLT